MQVELDRLSPTAVKLSVVVPFEELKPAIDRAYKRIAEQVNIPGFRKGKVPTSVIDQRFGKGAVIQEALDEAVSSAYSKAIDDNGLTPVSTPQVEITDIVDNGPVSFTAEVEVRPDFTIPEFTSLQVEVDAVKVDADLVDEQVEALRKRFGTFTTVDRECQDGDMLLVDIKGELDGVELEEFNGSSLSYEVGTDGMLPGFDDAIRGAKAEETRSLPIKPEAGEYEGKDITVTATVKAVRDRALPELNDAFAQLASEFDTLDELRADLENRLARMKRLEQGYQARDKVQQALVDAVEMPLPAGVLAKDLEEHFQDGHGDDAHRSEYEESSSRSLKLQFILDKIAEDEQLGVNDAELSAWLMQQAPRYGMTAQEFADQLVKAGNVPMAVADVRRTKAIELVLKSIMVVDSEGKVVDLEALDADLPL